MNTGITDRLQDIHGLDPISPWPPGPGWWLLLGAVLLALLLIIVVYRWLLYRNRRAAGKWRKDAATHLHALRRRANKTDSKTMAGELSELIRRIAIARCGRESCASLNNHAWLQWLTDNDPERYDWVKRGQLLIDLPYAPDDGSDSTVQLQELVNAALAWTRSAKPCREAGDV